MQSHQRKPRFAPRVETLESRSCPSVTAVQSGDTLRVTGTGNDILQVVATGDESYRVQSGTPIANTGGHGYHLSGTPQSFSGVECVMIQLGPGRNYLNLNLGAVPERGQAMVQIYGNGVGEIPGSNVTATNTDRNNITVDLGTGLKDHEHVRLDVAPGMGTNRFTLGGTLGRPYGGATLNDRSDLDLDYGGGGGTDSVTLNFFNLNKRSRAELNVNLGGGDDTFRMNLPQTGGGNVGAFDDRALIDLNLDGGPGNDTARFSAKHQGNQFNANLQNVESISGFTNYNNQNNNNTHNLPPLPPRPND